MAQMEHSKHLLHAPAGFAQHKKKSIILGPISVNSIVAD